MKTRVNILHFKNLKKENMENNGKSSEINKIYPKLVFSSNVFLVRMQNIANLNSIQWKMFTKRTKWCSPKFSVSWVWQFSNQPMGERRLSQKRGFPKIRMLYPSLSSWQAVLLTACNMQSVSKVTSLGFSNFLTDEREYCETF